jgi:hypothetical protein
VGQDLGEANVFLSLNGELDEGNCDAVLAVEKEREIRYL